MIREFLPASALVGIGLAPFHGQHRVYEQYTLGCPLDQIAVGRHVKTQIIVNFPVDVYQGFRQWVSRFYRKAHAAGLIRFMIGILAQYYDLDLVQIGIIKSREDFLLWRIYRLFSILLLKKGRQFPEIILLKLVVKEFIPALVYHIILFPV